MTSVINQKFLGWILVIIYIWKISILQASSHPSTIIHYSQYEGNRGDLLRPPSSTNQRLSFPSSLHEPSDDQVLVGAFSSEDVIPPHNAYKSTSVQKTEMVHHRGMVQEKTAKKTPRKQTFSDGVNSVEELLAEMKAEKEQEKKLADILPLVTFDCHNRAEGYYADVSFSCDVFHYCGKPDGRRFTFFCPAGSRFNQIHLICDYDRFQGCDQSQDYFHLNEHIYPKQETVTASAEIVAPSQHSRVVSSSFEKRISIPAASSQSPIIEASNRLYTEPVTTIRYHPTVATTTKSFIQAKSDVKNGTHSETVNRRHHYQVPVTSSKETPKSSAKSKTGHRSPRPHIHHHHHNLPSSYHHYPARHFPSPRSRHRPPSARAPPLRRKPLPPHLRLPEMRPKGPANIRVLPPLHLDGNTEDEEQIGFAIVRPRGSRPFPPSAEFMRADILQEMSRHHPPSPLRELRGPPFLRGKPILEEGEFLPHPLARVQSPPPKSDYHREEMLPPFKNHTHGHSHHYEWGRREDYGSYRKRPKPKHHVLESKSDSDKMRQRDQEQQTSSRRKTESKSHQVTSSKSSPFRQWYSEDEEKQLDEEDTEDVGFGQSNHFYSSQYSRRKNYPKSKNKPKPLHLEPQKTKVSSRPTKDQYRVKIGDEKKEPTKSVHQSSLHGDPRPEDVEQDEEMSVENDESSDGTSSKNEEIREDSGEEVTLSTPTTSKSYTSISESKARDLKTTTTTEPYNVEKDLSTVTTSSTTKSVITVTPSRVITRKRVHTSSIGGRVNNWPLLSRRRTTTPKVVTSSSVTLQSDEAESTTSSDEETLKETSEGTVSTTTKAPRPVTASRKLKPKWKSHYSRSRTKVPTTTTSATTFSSSVEDTTILMTPAYRSQRKTEDTSNHHVTTKKSVLNEDVEEKSYLK